MCWYISPLLLLEKDSEMSITMGHVEVTPHRHPAPKAGQSPSSPPKDRTLVNEMGGSDPTQTQGARAAVQASLHNNTNKIKADPPNYNR